MLASAAALRRSAGSAGTLLRRAGARRVATGPSSPADVQSLQRWGARLARAARTSARDTAGAWMLLPPPLPPPGTLAWACSVQGPCTSCAGAARQPSRHPSSLVVGPSVHAHARRTQHLAKATAATKPNPDANPRRSQAHDNTYLSYSRNAIISTVAGGALVRQHAPHA